MPSGPHSYYPSPQPTMPTAPTASTSDSQAALMSKAERSRAAETGFLEAINPRKWRRGRSTSRNRVEKSRSRSRSPMVLPPEQMPTQRAAPVSQTQAPAQRPPQPRHVSTTSQSSIQVPRSPTSPTRPSTQHRSSDLWHGRQTNSWLFNDFSFRETAKDMLHHSSGSKLP